MAGSIHIKQIHEAVSPEDGLRILTDRQWPAGLSKAQAPLWFREAAPTDTLRIWYESGEGDFTAFRERYLHELRQKSDAAFVYTLEKMLRQGDVTLLYAAEDAEHSSAAILAGWLARRLADRDRIREEKKALRRQVHAKGETLDGAYREEANRQIRERVLASDFWQQANSVFLFVSMWDEPDTYALLEDALQGGKAVYVPRMYPGRIMKAVRIYGLDELQPGTMGIPEPVNDRETAGTVGLSLALIPCVTAARDGRRMGHGVGYYDRFLVDRRCRKVCLCYEALLSDEVPMDTHDIPMDAVVTEKEIYRR